ncbi:hypothetical protein DSO57_1010757 [Entomophthora muscae]|uniref:Uncharacterized protein n=1 Tax=Entomophthora muscae TaxID=34485 RepID=A0ACC2THC7_9FUNG|nr:hypothetical protein DSO57_1010757 [Entomophthora muscae]
MHPVLGLLRYILYNLILNRIISGRWGPASGTLSLAPQNVNFMPANFVAPPPILENENCVTSQCPEFYAEDALMLSQFSLLSEIASYKSNLQQFRELALSKVTPQSLAEVEQFIQDCTNFTMINDSIFKKVDGSLQLVPKIGNRAAILKEAHEGAGHFGRDITLERLKATYWWPGM